MENIPVLYIFFNFLAICYLMAFNTIYKKVKEDPTDSTIDILTILTVFSIPFLVGVVYISIVRLLNAPAPEDIVPVAVVGFFVFEIVRAAMFRAKNKK